MNISQISFSGREQNEYAVNHSQISQQAAATRAKLRGNTGLPYDTFEISSKPTQPKKQQHPQQKKVANKNTKVVDANKYAKLVKENSFFRALVLGASAIGCIACLHGKPAETLDAVTVPVSYGESIIQVAEIYGSDADVIIEANNLEGNEVEKSMRIVIPSEYSPIEDEIKELQEKLFSSDLKQDEREEIETQILNLQNQIERQQSIAQSYTDGEFIYFKLTLPTDGSENHIQAKYNGAINVEEFKRIFNIADGAIKDNNYIGFEWTEGGTVMEYSNQDLYDGDVIKVPVDAITIK